MEGKTIGVTYAPTITDKVSSKSFQIQFETGSAVIKPESYAVLDEILKSTVVAENLKVGVYGHTDNVGGDAYNQELSERRAETVRDTLAGMGVGADRITTRGYGRSFPVATNGTEAGRQLNRRVEVVISDESGNIRSR